MYYLGGKEIRFVMMPERITVSPNICHGKPYIRGMRWPVMAILYMLGVGITVEKVVQKYPELETEGITASLVAYAQRVLDGGAVHAIAS